MKRLTHATLILGLGAACLLAAQPRAHADAAAAVREARRGAVAKAEAGLATANLSGKGALAMATIVGDADGGVAQSLVNAATRSGLAVVVGTGNPEFEALLARASQTLRDRQFLDPATVAEMGRLLEAGMLMYGRIDTVSTADGVFVELAVHILEVETGRYLWGDVFTQRHYFGDNVRGLVDLTPEIRDLFNQVAAAAGESMGTAPRLAGAKTVLIVPLAGDIDGYATGHLRNAISRTALAPVDLGVRSLPQARILAEAEAADKMPDAILVGAVRDVALRMVGVDGGGETWRWDVEIEAQIIDARTNAVLWSDTIGRSLTQSVSVADKFFQWLNENPIRYAYLIGAVLVLALALKALRTFKKAATRVR